MGLRAALGASVAAALIGAAPVAGAPASDAQVKAAVVRTIAVVDHQRAASLRKGLVGARTSLSRAKPASAKARSARKLALQAVAKASLAAAEQVKAELANTKMQYDEATTETTLATRHLAAADKLLNRAAGLLGIARKAR
jgi:hypothetical protein